MAVRTDLEASWRCWKPQHSDQAPQIGRQARQWANARWLRNATARVRALVLRLDLDRDWLTGCEALSFPRPIQDSWDLVTDCRGGFPPHQRAPNGAPFEVVYGPVTIWPQRLVIQDCDQISFHTQPMWKGG